MRAREGRPEGTCALKEACEAGRRKYRVNTDILEALEPFIKVPEILSKVYRNHASQVERLSDE